MFNLRSCHLRLTLGRVPLCIHIIGTERKVQVRPFSWIFEQYEQWTEPQLNLRWTWVYCLVILLNSSLRLLDRYLKTTVARCFNKKKVLRGIDQLRKTSYIMIYYIYDIFLVTLARFLTLHREKTLHMWFSVVFTSFDWSSIITLKWSQDNWERFKRFPFQIEETCI